MSKGDKREGRTADSTTSRSNRYTERWKDSDILFHVENEKFFCHYAVLKINSPIFKANFSGKFKKGNDKLVEMELPGKEKESFTLFLDLMYPMVSDYETEGANLTQDLLNKVLALCAEYQAEYAEHRIDMLLGNAFLKNLNFGTRHLTETLALTMENLILSETHSLWKTRRMAMQYLLLHADDIDSGKSRDESTSIKCIADLEHLLPRFNELSGETRFDIVKAFIDRHVEKYTPPVEELQGPLEEVDGI